MTRENGPRILHEVILRHARGPLNLDVEFTLDAGWTVLFAPSGAGKTTILRMIAGLDQPDSGRIVRSSHTAQSSSTVLLNTAAKVCVPAHQRLVRMTAQRPALFPHRSVIRNIAYGCSMATREADERSGRDQFLNEVLTLCRVSHLRDKMPSQLSGGERQRVAVARTLASLPCCLLLLDEPFTGLELALRDELITDLRTWTSQRGIPVLLVTHDLGEVFSAHADVLKLENGRIIASGPAGQVLAQERDHHIRRFQPTTNLSS